MRHVKAATWATARIPCGRVSPNRRKPATIGTAFVTMVAVPAAVRASPFWYADCSTLVPMPYPMMSVTRAISHAPPYPMSFAEMSPIENSRPVARPSEAARPKSMGMAMRNAAPAPHAASQMMMPRTGGRC